MTVGELKAKLEGFDDNTGVNIEIATASTRWLYSLDNVLVLSDTAYEGAHIILRHNRKV